MRRRLRHSHPLRPTDERQTGNVAELTDFELLHGRDVPPEDPLEVWAGPLVAALDGIELRWICLGETEVLHGIYPAIRDDGWGTLPVEIQSIEREIDDQTFLVQFEARSRQGTIDITWGGRIEGNALGAIVYSFEGFAESTFRYCRIGLNVLHPASAAGRPFRGESPEGPVHGRLPTHLEPPPVVDGVFYGLFPAVSRLVVEVADGVAVLTVFEGDLFEMEDQRNWTDASFKTYSTPLALGVPLEATPGKTFAQTVHLSAHATRPSRRRSTTSPISIELGEPLEQRLPALGLGLPENLTPPTPSERARLAALALDHVRADLNPQVDGWRERLEAAAAYARALDTRLELALHPPPDSGSIDTIVSGSLTETPLARVLVLAEGCVTTPGELVIAVRERLRELGVECPVGGGTDAFFADLNIERPDQDAMDFVGYSISPQVHAFDDASIMETGSIQGLTVDTARSWSGPLPMAVTPITLRMRHNPYAASERSTSAEELPSNVDHRQGSLLCAAWAAASLASLAYSGADSVTYFETVGWRGVLERELGSLHPDLFRSEPAMTFPVYYVLEVAADCRAGALVDCSSSSADNRVSALAVQMDDALRVLVVNLTPRRQTAELARLPCGAAAARRLDVSAARSLMHRASTLTDLTDAADVVDGRLILDLPPYAVGVVDACLSPGAAAKRRDV